MVNGKIGVLTSGGDAPGMNAAIRAVVRTAIVNDIEVIGIKRGFAGIFDDEMISMKSHSVSNCIHRGGTILYSSRCHDIHTDEGLYKAVSILRSHGIEHLICIGGDGTTRGAKAISDHGMNVMVIPGTIDMDMTCTDYTIGFDTAINTVIDAVDKIKDTTNSHLRCSVVEVMGRHSGYIALWSGIATGAEEVLIPNIFSGDIEPIVCKIKSQMSQGKKHFIIINSEGVGDSINLAKRIEEETGIETRATILGYMQRGGMPTCKDRFYATIMGSKAVEEIINGKKNEVIVYRGGDFFGMPIEEAINTKKEFPIDYMNLFRKY